MEKNNKKDLIFMVSIILILFVVTFIVSETTFTRHTIEDIEDNTGINITETNPDQNELKTNNQEESEEKDWISIGTNTSKISSVYTELYSYIYEKSYPSGGLSFTSEELMRFIVTHIDESDLEDLQKDTNQFTTGFLSDDKATTILKNYFGENYRVDTRFIPEHGITGYMYRITSYDTERKGFIIAIVPFGMEYGPSAILDLRKTIGVYERNNEIKIEEKAIYTKSTVTGNNMCYNIYANPEKTIYINQICASYEEIGNYTISVEDYMDQASTITSVFRQSDDGSYYFVSSNITS